MQSQGGSDDGEVQLTTCRQYVSDCTMGPVKIGVSRSIHRSESSYRAILTSRTICCNSFFAQVGYDAYGYGYRDIEGLKVQWRDNCRCRLLPGAVNNMPPTNMGSLLCLYRCPVAHANHMAWPSKRFAP